MISSFVHESSWVILTHYDSSVVIDHRHIYDVSYWSWRWSRYSFKFESCTMPTLSDICVQFSTTFTVPEWRWRRRTMMPFFNSDKLVTYSHVMYEKSRHTSEELQTWAGTGKVCDLWDSVSALTFRILSGLYRTLCRHLGELHITRRNHYEAFFFFSYRNTDADRTGSTVHRFGNTNIYTRYKKVKGNKSRRSSFGNDWQVLEINTIRRYFPEQVNTSQIESHIYGYIRILCMVWSKNSMVGPRLPKGQSIL